MAVLQALDWKRNRNLQGSKVRGQGSLVRTQQGASGFTYGKPNRTADGLDDRHRQREGEGRG